VPAVAIILSHCILITLTVRGNRRTSKAALISHLTAQSDPRVTLAPPHRSEVSFAGGKNPLASANLCSSLHKVRHPHGGCGRKSCALSSVVAMTRSVDCRNASRRSWRQTFAAALHSEGNTGSGSWAEPAQKRVETGIAGIGYDEKFVNFAVEKFMAQLTRGAR